MSEKRTTTYFKSLEVERPIHSELTVEKGERVFYSGDTFLGLDRNKNFVLHVNQYDSNKAYEWATKVPRRSFAKAPYSKWVFAPIVTNLKPIGDLIMAMRPKLQAGITDWMIEIASKSKEMSELSHSLDEQLEIDGLGGTLYPFQNVSVIYISRVKRILLADEMGTGKTPQTLAAAQYLNAFPLRVVCPASAKLNWAKEAATWLPHRSVGIVSGHSQKPGKDIEILTKHGKRAIKVNDFSVDILICNYAIIEKNEKPFSRGIAMFVADESHYIKNPEAKRTQACFRVSEAADYVSLLSGTPLKNHTIDLLPQLMMLGMVGKGKPLGTEWDFKQRFCNPRSTRFGMVYVGGTHSKELNTMLKASCMIRRTKEQVLPELPPITRSVIPCELPPKFAALCTRAVIDPGQVAREMAASDPEIDKHIKKYMGKSLDDVHPDSRDYFMNQYLGLRHVLADFNADLIKLILQRRIIGEGKIKAAVEWIKDFLEEDQKLVVFAVHRYVQSALLEQFPDAAHVLGDDSPHTRFRNVERFQNEEGCRLIICGLLAAAEAITLTAASNVLFVEFGWTPTEHTQAEARIHRIGQTDSRVTAWYLYALGTLDEHIAGVVEDKMINASNVIDGDDPLTPFIATLAANIEEGKSLWD